MRRFLHIALMALLIFGTPAAFAVPAPHAEGAKAPLDEGCAGAHSELIPDLAGTDVNRRVETRIDAANLTGQWLGAYEFAELGAADRLPTSVAALCAPIYLLHCSLLR
jgi:hypothetical protein